MARWPPWSCRTSKLWPSTQWRSTLCGTRSAANLWRAQKPPVSFSLTTWPPSVARLLLHLSQYSAASSPPIQTFCPISGTANCDGLEGVWWDLHHHEGDVGGASGRSQWLHAALQSPEYGAAGAWEGGRVSHVISLHCVPWFSSTTEGVKTMLV